MMTELLFFAVKERVSLCLHDAVKVERYRAHLRKNNGGPGDKKNTNSEYDENPRNAMRIPKI